MGSLNKKLKETVTEEDIKLLSVNRDSSSLTMKWFLNLDNYKPEELIKTLMVDYEDLPTLMYSEFYSDNIFFKWRLEIGK